MTSAEALAREVARLDPSIASDVKGQRVVFSVVVTGARYALGVDMRRVAPVHAADVIAAASDLRMELAGGAVVG